MASPISINLLSENVLSYSHSNVLNIAATSFNTSALPKNGGTGELRIQLNLQKLLNYGTVNSITISYKAYGTRTGILGSKAQIRTGYWDYGSGAFVTAHTHGDVGRGSGNATSYTDTIYPSVSNGAALLFFNMTNPIASQTNEVYVHSISISIAYTPDYSTIYTAVSPAGGGTITGGGTFECGTQITLTAAANNGYKFVKWSDGVDINPRPITVGNNDATYTAEFLKNPPQFLSVEMKYLDKQISASNKVICNEDFIISVKIT